MGVFISEKLQKILSRAGQGSRRDIESMIKQGRVKVNGAMATIGNRLEVNTTTKICIDKRIVAMGCLDREAACRVLAYYKPNGVLCTRRDPENRPTVFGNLPLLDNARWVCIGRLDVNTSGLLLLTTDGELANGLMHPSHELEREYTVRVFGVVDKKKKHRLISGIQLRDGLAAFRRLTFQGGEGLNQWYNVTVTEGRNRIVRRLWEKVGVQVSRLIRVRYGSVCLPRNISPGNWIELSLETINDLRRKIQLPPRPIVALSGRAVGSSRSKATNHKGRLIENGNWIG